MSQGWGVCPEREENPPEGWEQRGPGPKSTLKDSWWLQCRGRPEKGLVQHPFRGPRGQEGWPGSQAEPQGSAGT